MEEVKKVPDEETGGGRQNTMKILDKREEAWEEKKKSDGWNGYHVLFTETTQFLIIWEDMKKKLKIAYFATLAFLILFVVCLGGAGIRMILLIWIMLPAMERNWTGFRK